jgi:hypothetical protein
MPIRGHAFSWMHWRSLDAVLILIPPLTWSTETRPLNSAYSNLNNNGQDDDYYNHRVGCAHTLYGL